MRPGCLADATDDAQIQELLILGQLVERARARGTGDGGRTGAVPLNQIQTNVEIQKLLCRGAPFMCSVL